MRRRTTRITVERGRGVFMISVAAELAEMHPQTLRMYEQRGLIEPKRSPKGTRLYSQEDVERLRRIQEMTTELGLNLAGVERVLALEEQLEAATRRMQALEQRSAEMRAEMEAEMEQVRRSLRAEIVPYMDPDRHGHHPGPRRGARAAPHPRRPRLGLVRADAVAARRAVVPARLTHRRGAAGVVEGQVVRRDLLVGLGGVAERPAIVLHARDTGLAAWATA